MKITKKDRQGRTWTLSMTAQNNQGETMIDPVTPMQVADLLQADPEYGVMVMKNLVEHYKYQTDPVHFSL